MRRFNQLLNLNCEEFKLVLRTVSLLWMVRVGLWILPYDKVSGLVFRRGSDVPTLNVSVKQIVRSVKFLSGYVPSATCLTTALVTMFLVKRAGHRADLRIGVTRSPLGKLEAHAWVESEGKIIIGGSHADIARYTVLRPV